MRFDGLEGGAASPEFCAEDAPIFGAALGSEPREPVQARTIVARSGEIVDVSTGKWRVSADKTISLAAFEANATIMLAMRAYLEFLLTNRSARYASNVSNWLNRLCSPISLTAIESDLARTGSLSLNSYRAFEKANAELTPNWLNGVRGAYIRWYLWCCDVGIEAFDEDIAAELSDIIIPRAVTGVAVMRSDPDAGPICPAELNNLIIQLRSAIGNRSLDPAELAIAWLFVTFGTNPLSMRLLFEEDLVITPLGDGSVTYELRIPRIKKRTSKSRTQFRTRELEPEIGRLIEDVISRNASFRETDPATATGGHPILFRSRLPREAVLESPFARWALQAREDWPIAALRNVVRDLGILNLSGTPLHISPRRLRYTFATNLVEDGATPMEVADALDHSSVDHVMVYFNSRSDVVRRLDRALDRTLAPLAQAFLGTIVRSRTDARRGNEAESVVRYHSPALQAVRPVGTCGTYSFCDLAAPLACYTCAEFQPWLEADHQAVLDAELDKRAKKLARGADARWTQIHDKTIAAIQYVVDRCCQLLADSK